MTTESIRNTKQKATVTTGNLRKQTSKRLPQQYQVLDTRSNRLDNDRWKRIRKALKERKKQESKEENYLKQDKELQRLLLGKLQKRGQTGTGQKLLNKTIEQLGHWLPLKLALTKLTPLLLSKQFKKSGKIHHIPTGIPSTKRLSTALSWLLDSSRKRSNRSSGGLVKGLLEEIKEINKSQGQSWKKKTENYQLAFSNRVWLKKLKKKKEKSNKGEKPKPQNKQKKLKRSGVLHGLTNF